jgi:hypothetical protein
MNTYDVGDLVRLTGTFTDLTAALADPTTVTLKTRGPFDATSTVVTLAGAQVVKDSTGVYHYDFAPTEAGVYSYEWIGTGAVATAEPGSFFVRASL